MRFDEVELEAVALEVVDGDVEDAPRSGLSWFKRLLALLTDLSLFAALTLALLPLLPPAPAWMPVASLAGFVLVMSFYYFVGTWLLWGKTIGGAIFDVKVVSAADEAMSLRTAAARWGALLLSLALAGLPLLFRAPDRLSGTRCIAA
jgi:uncharacterized RDD family membrane protein YckC